MSVNNPESPKRSNMMETTVDQINPVADDCSEGPSTESVSADYSFVTAVARIALYDDLRSAPRVTEIQPAETGATSTASQRKFTSRLGSQAGRSPTPS